MEAVNHKPQHDQRSCVDECMQICQGIYVLLTPQNLYMYGYIHSNTLVLSPMFITDFDLILSANI